MSFNQGGLSEIKEITSANSINMSALQGTTIPYQFGDITRANFGKGSEIAANRALNLDEIFMDKNAVGLNPFQKLTPDQGQKLHTIG